MATYIFPMDRQFYYGHGRNRPAQGCHRQSRPLFCLKNESGTGPFKVTSREQGVKYVFDRFADYWDKRLPGQRDKIVLTPIKEDATRVAALLSGDVDFISPVPPQDFDRNRQRRQRQPVHLFRRPDHHHPAEPETPPGIQGRPGAAGHRLCHQQRGHRRKDHEGHGHPGRPAEPQRLRRVQPGPESRATTWQRPKR